MVLAGLIQIGLGIARAGFIAAFFPSSVIKGLLAAIGVILILKQIPHLFGHDPDPEGDMAFQQPDHENTFSELARMIVDIHLGAAVIGLVSIAVLVAWGKWKPLKKFAYPRAPVVVLLGVGLSLLFRQLGEDWVIGSSHLVQVPVADSLTGFPRVSPIARHFSVVEPGGVHCRRDDRRRRFAGNVIESGGGR